MKEPGSRGSGLIEFDVSTVRERVASLRIVQGDQHTEKQTTDSRQPKLAYKFMP